MQMQKYKKDKVMLGYRITKKHQSPITVHCAMRIGENHARKRQAAQIVSIAIFASNVIKGRPRIVHTLWYKEEYKVG